MSGSNNVATVYAVFIEGADREMRVISHRNGTELLSTAASPMLIFPMVLPKGQPPQQSLQDAVTRLTSIDMRFQDGVLSRSGAGASESTAAFKLLERFCAWWEGEVDCGDALHPVTQIYDAFRTLKANREGQTPTDVVS